MNAVSAFCLLLSGCVLLFGACWFLARPSRSLPPEEEEVIDLTDDAEPFLPEEEAAASFAELVQLPEWPVLFGILQEIGALVRSFSVRRTALSIRPLADGFRPDHRPATPEEVRMIEFLGFAPPERFVPWIRDLLAEGAYGLRPSELLHRLQARRDALRELKATNPATSGPRPIVAGSRPFADRLALLERRIAYLRRAVQAEGLRRPPATELIDLAFAQADASLRALRRSAAHPDDTAYGILARAEAGLDAFEVQLREARPAVAVSFASGLSPA